MKTTSVWLSETSRLTKGACGFHYLNLKAKGVSLNSNFNSASGKARRQNEGVLNKISKVL
jgi:hypothetical protein